MSFVILKNFKRDSFRLEVANAKVTHKKKKEKEDNQEIRHPYLENKKLSSLVLNPVVHFKLLPFQMDEKLKQGVQKL